MKGHPPTCFCNDCRGEDAISQPPPWSTSEAPESTAGVTKEKMVAIERLIESEVLHLQEYLFKEITKILLEDKVLPSADGEQTGKAKRKGSLTYLSNEMLSKTPKESRILAVKADPDNKFGARVILKLALEGQTIFWGVATKKNPNYRILLERFGPDENDWVDAKIMLNLEQDEFTGAWFPRVQFPEGRKGR